MAVHVGRVYTVEGEARRVVVVSPLVVEGMYCGVWRVAGLPGDRGPTTMPGARLSEVSGPWINNWKGDL